MSLQDEKRSDRTVCDLDENSIEEPNLWMNSFINRLEVKTLIREFGFIVMLHVIVSNFT